MLLFALNLSACGDGAEPEEMADDMEETMEDEAMATDIVVVATEDGRFNTLVSALQAAGLAETLQGEGPFTVFAPTDDAFAALPEGTLDNLLLPENQEQLRNILLYHVAEGEMMASDVTSMGSLSTLAGPAIPVTVSDGTVTLGDNATVVLTDVDAANGVIHVIDAVLMPPSDS